MAKCPPPQNPGLQQYTVYPCDIDSSAQLPVASDNVTPVRGEVINRQRSSIIAIEAELGILPSGTFTTVRARLDDIDARITDIISTIAALDLETILNVGNHTGNNSIIFDSGNGIVADSGTLPITGNITSTGTVTSNATIYNTLSSGPDSSLWIRSSDDHLIYTNSIGSSKDLSAASGGGGGSSGTWAEALGLGNSSDGYTVLINAGSVLTVDGELLEIISGGSLSIDNASTISLTNASNINMSGAGTLALSGSSQITMASGTEISQTTGNMILNGSTAGDPIILNIRSPSPASRKIRFDVNDVELGHIGLFSTSALLLQAVSPAALVGIGYITSGSTASAGGGVSLQAQSSTANVGGDVTILGGNTSSVGTHRGGNITLTGGTTTGGGLIGGTVAIVAGDGATGGAITLTSGSGITGGAIELITGGGGGASAGGPINLLTDTCAIAGDITITGGNSSISTGGHIRLIAGDAAGTGVDGADIELIPGGSSEGDSGRAGQVKIALANGDAGDGFINITGRALIVAEAIDDTSGHVIAGAGGALYVSNIDGYWHQVTTTGEDHAILPGAGGGGGSVTFSSVKAALAVANTAVSFNNQQLTGVLTPTLSTDAATKGYVDGYMSTQATSFTTTTIQPDDAAVVGVRTDFSRADHKHAIDAAAPSATFNLGSANSEGVATTFARSDHSHAFSTPAAPADVTKSAASAGVATTFARGDHKHDVSTAIPGIVALANAEGTATSLSRSDHVHALTFAVLNSVIGTANASISVNNQKITNLLTPTLSTDAANKGYVDGYLSSYGTLSDSNPVSIQPDDSASAGVSITSSRSDHRHAIATAAPITDLDFGTSNSEGAATSFARSDHTHAFTTPAAPANVTKAAASAGASNAFARADHKHDVTTAVVSNIGTANSEGSASSLARSDHVHNLPFTPVQTALNAASGTVGFNSQSLDNINGITVTAGVLNFSGDINIQDSSVTRFYTSTADNFYNVGTSGRHEFNSGVDSLLRISKITATETQVLSLQSDLTIRADGYVQIVDQNNVARWKSDSTGIGFHGTTPIAKPTLSGVRTLANTITALSNYGLVTDSTTDGFKFNNWTSGNGGTLNPTSADEVYKLNTGSSATTLNLPDPATTSGMMIYVKDTTGSADVNPISVYDAGSAGSIDGYVEPFICSQPRGSWLFANDGANWFALVQPYPRQANTFAISSDYILGPNDAGRMAMVDTGAARTIYLPNPTLKLHFYIKDASGTAATNNVTLSRYAAESIDGAPGNKTLAINRGCWYLFSDGTNYYTNGPS